MTLASGLPVQDSRRPAHPLLDGPQLFAHYSFMPNRLGYCGGADDNPALFDYVVAQASDAGLTQALKKFTGALPYMRLIARSNLIPDPFDLRVVEAYWIGNELLEVVEARELYDALNDRFRREMPKATLELVLGKAPAGARPHHSFHVIEVCPRNGWPQSVEYMDSCRISWGQVTAVNGSALAVTGPPLVLEGNQLVLGAPAQREIHRQIDGQGFVDAVQTGDWVSIHWGWACQVLSPRQVANLEKWTRYHLRIANETL